MLAAEALETARSWVEEEGRSLPGLCAVHLSGSVALMAPHEVLPDYSDLDLYCVVDDDARLFPQRKFRYRNVLLEVVAQPARLYRSAEEVLAHPFLAHLFLHPVSLWDPTGLLEPLYPRVRQEFAMPLWRRARCERIQTLLHGALEESPAALTLDAGFPALFRTLRLLCNHILIAALQPPTVRTVLCRAGTILEKTGDALLLEDLLRLLGCAHWTLKQVRASLSECTRAFDRAVQTRKSLSPALFNLDEAVRPYLIEGSEEMIQSGHAREAVLWIAVMRWTANRALQTDAPPAEQPHWQASMDRLYAQLGLSGPADLSRRREEAREVAATILRRVDALSDALVSES